VKVSIITVCFNSEKHISDCIDSVNRQSYQNIEHIFIDGNSSDNTTDIIVSRSKRNMTLISERDEGIYDAMNKGLRMASGEVIGFLNSDDLFDSEFVVDQLVNAFESSDLDALWGNLDYVYPSDTQKVLRVWRSRQLFPADLKRGFIPPHPSFYIKRSALSFLKCFDDRYSLASDFDFMKRAILCPSIKTDHLNFVVVRMRAGGATGNGISNILKQNAEIIHSLKMSFQRFSYVSYAFHKIVNKLRELIRALWNRRFGSH
jgi:glycosyltransferase involved in cell wall biosynthesis